MKPNNQGFFLATHYTPVLSALIYSMRLTLLKYALPLHQYSIGPPKRPLKIQAQRTRLNEMRQKYTASGSLSLLEELISLRRFGRFAARLEPPAVFLNWSEDGQTVTYNNKFSLTMQAFRDLANHFISSAQESSISLLCSLHVPGVI